MNRTGRRRTNVVLEVMALVITAGCDSGAVAADAGPGVEREEPAIQTAPMILSGRSVAIVYESVIDRQRPAEAVAEIVAELNVQYLHRGFFRWRGFAELERKHDVYGILAKTVAAVKKKSPRLIFGGALAAQEINVVEHDPLTGQTIAQDKTWQMALDPQKHGLAMSKRELHDAYWKKTGSRKYLLPDITNGDYQRLLLDMAKRQIDAGADAIWIDGLFVQAGIMARQTRKVSHPAVQAAVKAAAELVDQIHDYGRAKGRRIYVGSWSYHAYYTHGLPRRCFPALDFVTFSPSSEEVHGRRLDEAAWKQRIRLVKEIDANIAMIAFIDWAFTTKTPLGVFSQTLSQEQAVEALRNFDRFFAAHGILFAYPVHGGFLGRDARRLAFGSHAKYDALAPEFATYEIIKQLATTRSASPSPRAR